MSNDNFNIKYDNSINEINKVSSNYYKSNTNNRYSKSLKFDFLFFKKSKLKRILDDQCLNYSHKKALIFNKFNLLKIIVCFLIALSYVFYSLKIGYNTNSSINNLYNENTIKLNILLGKTTIINNYTNIYILTINSLFVLLYFIEFLVYSLINTIFLRKIFYSYSYLMTVSYCIANVVALVYVNQPLLTTFFSYCLIIILCLNSYICFNIILDFFNYLICLALIFYSQFNNNIINKSYEYIFYPQFLIITPFYLFILLSKKYIKLLLKESLLNCNNSEKINLVNTNMNYDKSLTIMSLFNIKYAKIKFIDNTNLKIIECNKEYTDTIKEIIQDITKSDNSNVLSTNRIQDIKDSDKLLKSKKLKTSNKSIINTEINNNYNVVNTSNNLMYSNNNIKNLINSRDAINIINGHNNNSNNNNFKYNSQTINVFKSLYLVKNISEPENNLTNLYDILSEYLTDTYLDVNNLGIFTYNNRIYFDIKYKFNSDNTIELYLKDISKSHLNKIMLEDYNIKLEYIKLFFKNIIEPINNSSGIAKLLNKNEDISSNNFDNFFPSLEENTTIVNKSLRKLTYSKNTNYNSSNFIQKNPSRFNSITRTGALAIKKSNIGINYFANNSANTKNNENTVNYSQNIIDNKQLEDNYNHDSIELSNFIDYVSNNIILLNNLLNIDNNINDELYNSQSNIYLNDIIKLNISSIQNIISSDIRKSQSISLSLINNKNINNYKINSKLIELNNIIFNLLITSVYSLNIGNIILKTDVSDNDNNVKIYVSFEGAIFNNNNIIKNKINLTKSLVNPVSYNINYLRLVIIKLLCDKLKVIGFYIENIEENSGFVISIDNSVIEITNSKHKKHNSTVANAEGSLDKFSNVIEIPNITKENLNIKAVTNDPLNLNNKNNASNIHNLSLNIDNINHRSIKSRKLTCNLMRKNEFENNVLNFNNNNNNNISVGNLNNRDINKFYNSTNNTPNNKESNKNIILYDNYDIDTTNNNNKNNNKELNSILKYSNNNIDTNNNFMNVASNNNISNLNASSYIEKNTEINNEFNNSIFYKSVIDEVIYLRKKIIVIENLKDNSNDKTSNISLIAQTIQNVIDKYYFFFDIKHVESMEKALSILSNEDSNKMLNKVVFIDETAYNKINNYNDIFDNIEQNYEKFIDLKKSLGLIYINISKSCKDYENNNNSIDLNFDYIIEKPLKEEELYVILNNTY